MPTPHTSIFNDLHEAPALRPALSYRRVSTTRQAETGRGLDRQLQAIEKKSKQLGYTIIDQHTDVGSGAGPASLSRRDGLAAVMVKSRQLGIPIFVSDLSRLTRDTDAFIAINRDIKVISCRKGENRSQQARLAAVERAEKNVHRIQQNTSKALGTKAAGGTILGNPDALARGRVASLLTRQRTAAAVISRIADVLDLRPELRQATCRDVAEALNDLGVFTARSRPWTEVALRRPLRRACEGLSELLEEIDQEVSEEDEREAAEIYRNNPRIGMF